MKSGSIVLQKYTYVASSGRQTSFAPSAPAWRTYSAPLATFSSRSALKFICTRAQRTLMSVPLSRRLGSRVASVCPLCLGADKSSKPRSSPAEAAQLNLEYQILGPPNRRRALRERRVLLFDPTELEAIALCYPLGGPVSHARSGGEEFGFCGVAFFHFLSRLSDQFLRFSIFSNIASIASESSLGGSSSRNS